MCRPCCILDWERLGLRMVERLHVQTLMYFGLGKAWAEDDREASCADPAAFWTGEGLD